MSDPKISVIVPVYKVEQYIHRCVNSILKQSYTNLEVILVDDGSPDNCGEICEKYANEDGRVKVIHKENGGLSDARNTGTRRSNGKYIMYVDSDDWISQDCVELLYKSLIKTGADISAGLIIDAYNTSSGKSRKRSIMETNTDLYDVELALEELMYMHGFSNCAFAKLYKRELFNDLEYPIGKYYEDLATTYKLFSKSKKVVLIKEVVYYYFQNENSIMHEKYSNKRLEGIDFALEELKFISVHHPSIVNAAIYRLFFECLSCVSIMPSDKKERTTVWRYIKRYRAMVLNDKKLYRRQRMLCYASFFGPMAVKFAFFVQRRLRKRRTIHLGL